MYCPHCQMLLEHNATFCPGCGRRVDAPPSFIPDLSASPEDMPQNPHQPRNVNQVPTAYPNVTQSVVVQPVITNPGYPAQDPYIQYQQRSAMRQIEISVLSEIIRHFSAQQGSYDAYDSNAKNLVYYAKGATDALLVWGIIVTVLGIIFSNIAVGFGMVFWIPGCMMIFGGILMKVSSRNKLNKCRNTHKQLTQELYQHYLKYTNCPVGPEYTNPKILQVLMNILQSGRCDSIKEAINCMLSGGNQKVITRYYQQMQKQVTSLNAELGICVIFAAGHLYR